MPVGEHLAVFDVVHLIKEQITHSKVYKSAIGKAKSHWLVRLTATYDVCTGCSQGFEILDLLSTGIILG